MKLSLPKLGDTKKRRESSVHHDAHNKCEKATSVQYPTLGVGHTRYRLGSKHEAISVHCTMKIVQSANQRQH